MNAITLCTREVATCGPQSSIVEAAEKMRAMHAGDLVVVREEAGVCVPVGILTDRDIVLAVSKAQSEGYNPDATRLVDFMGSYPPGDMALGELRGPMADETVSWLNRVSLGLPTAAATVEEAHRNLMLTKALDLSAKRKQSVKLPLDADDMKAVA